MLQFKIPQNVEVEDKIVGPLTMKQLVICAGGGGVCYVLYLTLAKSYFVQVWAPPIAFIATVTLAVAFLEIRGIKFIKWILLMIEAMMNPNKRMWDKRESTQLVFMVPSAKLQEMEKKQAEREKEEELAKNKDAPRMDELSKALNMTTEALNQHNMPAAGPAAVNPVPAGSAATL